MFQELSSKEKAVFKMLASEPPRMERHDNSLLYLFSYQARERLEDYSLGTVSYLSLFFLSHRTNIYSANVMVNSIAVALGSPQNSNHIYTYAFDFGNSGPCSPGSEAAGKKKVDYGVR
jgi:hypothetical protein